MAGTARNYSTQKYQEKRSDIMPEKVLFYKGALEEADGTWKLMGNHCKDCGKTTYPRMERCAFCGSLNHEPVELSKTGTIYSFHTVRVPVGPYAPPIIGGLIDLPEGVRLYSQVHAPDGSIKAGMKLKMELGTLYTQKDGTEVFGFYYVPDKG